MKALIFEGKVVDVVSESFPVHEDMAWVACPPECSVGSWGIVNGVLQVLPLPVKTSEEALTEIRVHRNYLLAECDWRVLPDRPVSQSWLNYRQALRDLPANTVDPSNVTWPTSP